jgi:hypothetical protein
MNILLELDAVAQTLDDMHCPEGAVTTRLARTALQEQLRNSAWQPIETAPRDGSRIIVYRPKFDGDYIPQVGWDFWMTKGLLEPTWGKSRKDVPPTHWMPFPEPPR